MRRTTPEARAQARERNAKFSAAIAEREGWQGAVWVVLGSHRIHEYAERAGVRMVACYSFDGPYRYLVASEDVSKLPKGSKVLAGHPSAEYRQCISFGPVA